MKGLELSRKYFETFGLPMLKEQFPQYLDRLAIGLVGHGSECFGYDDELSLDHDYEPGFCIWLSKKDDEEFGFKLFRAYQKLPKEFMGIKIKEESIFGSKYKGVHTIEDFYHFYLGSDDLPKDLNHWLAIEDFYLAEATNGEIFLDNLGEFSRIREALKNRPEDVRLKKLSDCLLLMAQAGQYNYERCFKHGQALAAGNALSIFIENTCKAIYLINKKYCPYYKWMYKGLGQLEKLNEVEKGLYELFKEPYNHEKNLKIIEDISKKIIEELAFENLIQDCGDYLEPYVYQIKDKIKDNDLRNS